MKKQEPALSAKEMSRVEVIRSTAAKELGQAEAAARLDLSVRQIKRLVARFRAEGEAGLASRLRGRRSNRAFPEDLKRKALELVGERYHDFGPTFASEMLAERHDIQLSPSTLRNWMIEAGLWRPKRRRAARVHQPRPRRPCLGELVQIDGSPHDWFEGRADPCALIVFIDDATSRLLAARFVPAETTYAYMETLAQHMQAHGRPAAVYSDKHSIFRTSQPDRHAEPTQFARALSTLDIKLINANTPQAKGRVERANQTLQDRLVKELRLEGISDLAAANRFLSGYIDKYNARFAVPPASDVDAHRPPLHSDAELRLILTLHHTRKLSRNLVCQYNNRAYLVQAKGAGYQLRGARVTVCEAASGEVTLLRQGKPLRCRVLAEGEPLPPLTDEKGIGHIVRQARKQQAQRPKWKPAPDHPWRRLALGGRPPIRQNGDIAKSA